MSSQKQVLFLLSLLLIITSACAWGGTSDPAALATPDIAMVATAAANITAAEGDTHNTPIPTAVGNQQAIATAPSLTPVSPTLTPTPSKAFASVSQNTSCRSGPGVIYEYLGALLIGEQAEVIAKSSATNYWIVKNPDQDGECWLWGEYATILGNTGALPERASPPPPLPTLVPVSLLPNAPVNFSVTRTCTIPSLPGYDYQMVANLIWTDMSSNESGFRIYKDDTLIHTTGTNATSAAVTVNVYTGVTVKLSIDAYNANGPSSQQTGTAVCP